MKTMFVAKENTTKKRFQKPNILRKSSKLPPKPSIPAPHKSPNAKSESDEAKLEKIAQYKQGNKKPIQRLPAFENEETNEGGLYQIDGNLDTDRSLAVTCEVLTNNNEENVFETTINIESFINTADMEQMVTTADVESDLSSRKKGDWCLDFINDAQEIIIEDVDGSHLGSLRLAPTPVTSVSTSAMTSSERPTLTSTAPTQNITLEYLNCTINFKCDFPNCTKRFRSEQALKKHKGTHTKAKVVNRPNKAVVIQCPVKKTISDGREEPCEVVCTGKDEIVKHLNDCHDPEDAMYVCAECGRRFYWASALRGHARTHAGSRGGGGGGKAMLVCGWAGCARAFRQPCRLREHMRAHTGDKPYPCYYPNCGWSFRTASKLLRHARRHTGERRHPCEQCGRAFRRREHLRDHTNRHHAHKHACAHTGCKKKFNCVEKLYLHMEKEHLDEENIAAPLTTEEDLTPANEADETYVVKLGSPELYEDTPSGIEATTVELLTEPVAEIPAVADLKVAVADLPSLADLKTEAEVASPRAARTHCTWPFPAPASPHYQHDSHEYVLEEEVQVEVTEGSESNIYTIRSDLFLHGNVLINEDSEQMGGPGVVVGNEAEGEGEAGRGEEEGEGSLLVVGGGLLDTHPTSDLMQEELMYTDAAVDESSFRVFLLSGEELA